MNARAASVSARVPAANARDPLGFLETGVSGAPRHPAFQEAESITRLPDATVARPGPAAHAGGARGGARPTSVDRAPRAVRYGRALSLSGVFTAAYASTIPYP